VSLVQSGKVREAEDLYQFLIRSHFPNVSTHFESYVTPKTDRFGVYHGAPAHDMSRHDAEGMHDLGAARARAANLRRWGTRDAAANPAPAVVAPRSASPQPSWNPSTKAPGSVAPVAVSNETRGTETRRLSSSVVENIYHSSLPAKE